MEPAPYGGFMTRTLASENEQKDLLALQAVEVTVGGVAETVRPDAIHLRGVDNLSTEQIEAFVDLYLNVDGAGPEYPRRDDAVWFRVQWVDDSSANVLFKSHAHSLQALQRLSEDWPADTGSGVADTGSGPAQDAVFSPALLAALVAERRARPYAPTIAYLAHQQRLKELAEGADLFLAKKAQLAEQRLAGMDEDGSAVVLHVRQALQLDRKVKNAAAYSRYYLLHGEPDRTRARLPRRGGGGGDRGTYSRDSDGEDLFAAKIKTRELSGEFPGAQDDDAGDDDEEDLFAWRLRERSPAREQPE